MKLTFYYRVRGICATALSKIILDDGHCLTNVSLPIKKRLQIGDDLAHPPDAYVLENPTKTGFFCRGEVNAVDTLEQLLLDRLYSPFILRPPLKPNLILKGKVSRVGRQDAKITLTKNYQGRLLPPLPSGLFKGQELIVCIKGHEIYSKSAIPVSTSLTISGKRVAILTNLKRALFSKYMPRKRKEELERIELPFEDLPFPCTVRWRSAAIHSNTEELLAEIKLLKTRLETILDQAEITEAGTILSEGQGLFHVYLSSLEKKKLDQVRNSVIPTIPGHHLWKSQGPFYIDFVDYMDSLLEKRPEIGQELADTFKQFILEKMKERRLVNIFHWKPHGKYFKLGSATIKEITDNSLTLLRQVHSDGMYDGLGVRKEKNDLIETIIPLHDEWWLQHKYHSVNGQLKGSYYNINTPVELSIDNVRYFDLIVDVVKLPDSPPEIIDLEELERYVNRDIIRPKLQNKILEIAKQLEGMARSKEEEPSQIKT